MDPSAGATVFSTPNMIMLMERAAKEALRPYLETGEESVGTRVDIVHLAATPIGAAVRAEATVTAIDGRNIEFDVVAYDELEPIGRGRHTRAVVKLDRVRQKLSEKIEKLPPGSGVLLPMNMQPDRGVLPALKLLKVEIEDAVATVTLNRPEALNAVNSDMTEEWERLCGWLMGHPEVRIVIVSGAGRAFCAGNDVKEIATFSPEQAQAYNHRQARLWLSFEQLPQVMIAAINGPCLGGGMIIAASCDLRLASFNATFGMPEVKLGWTPSFGIAQLITTLGKSAAIWLCLTGETIEARTAEQLGFVQQLVAGAQLIPAANKLADTLLANSAEAMRQTKRTIHLDEGMQPKIAYLNDSAAYVRCLATPEARKRLEAFGQK